MIFHTSPHFFFSDTNYVSTNKSDDFTCEFCSKRNLHCNYREVTRKRQRQNVSPDEEAPISGDSDLASSVLKPSRMQRIHRKISRKSVFNCVKVTKRPGHHVVYGPSSNIRMVSHLHNMLGESTILSEDEAYDLWLGPREILMRDHLDPEHGANILFLQYEVVNGFLELYLRTTYHLIPIISADVLQSNFERMYDPSADAVPPSHRALVLLVVAIGASHSGNHEQASAFVTMARRELGHVYTETTNEAIQASFLMISYRPAFEV